MAGKVAPSLPSREFFPGRPMERFATDVSQFAIGAGKLHLSPITGMGTNGIVAYDVSRSANLQQMNRMLGKISRALMKNKAKGAKLHSGQGWQCQTYYYQGWLKSNNVAQGMPGKATTHDNAITGTFFGRMKAGMFYCREKNIQDTR